MKKTTWLLLAISLVAMLLVAGCAPTTPTPTASPTPTPTVAPTTPPADKECPKVVSTVVSKIYAMTTSDANFKITITFNEDVYTQCADNPANWAITISNPLTSRADKRWLGTAGLTAPADATQIGNVTIKTITIKDNKIIIEAIALDNGFYGLICSPTDASSYYKTVFTGNPLYWDGVDPKYSIDYADEICWELKNSCVISDELGNGCCGYSGCDCCVEPVCEECEEYCPMGEETCQ